MHLPGAKIHLLVDYTLEPTQAGTRLTTAAARPEGSVLARTIFNTAAPSIMKRVETALGHFKDRVEAEAMTFAAVPSS
jgi:hypothetical protein